MRLLSIGAVALVLARAATAVADEPAGDHGDHGAPIDRAARIDRTAGDAAARCAQARALVGHGDLTGAAFLVEACPASDPLAKALPKALGAHGYGLLEIVTKPAGAAVVLAERPDLVLHGGDDVELPAGTYKIIAGELGSSVTLPADGRALALLELPRSAAPPVDHAIDFDDQGGGDVVIGPPPKDKHVSLLPARYQRILAVEGGGGELVDDAGAADPDRARVGVWAGPTVTSLTGDGWHAIASVSVAALVRSRARGRVAGQLELEWAQRGAARAGMTAHLQTVAVPIAAHVRLARSPAIALGGVVGIAPELRLSSSFGGAAVDRLGASAIAGLDAELTSLPLRIEVRGELGLATIQGDRAWAIGASVGALLF
jgi:hypothetical protein